MSANFFVMFSETAQSLFFSKPQSSEIRLETTDEFEFSKFPWLVFSFNVLR